MLSLRPKDRPGIKPTEASSRPTSSTDTTPDEAATRSRSYPPSRLRSGRRKRIDCAGANANANPRRRGARGAEHSRFVLDGGDRPRSGRARRMKRSDAGRANRVSGLTRRRGVSASSAWSRRSSLMASKDATA
jgi:hypothetical protein